MTAQATAIARTHEATKVSLETDVLKIVQGWNYDNDTSERASAPGVLYLVDSQTIQEIEGLFALTAKLLQTIMEMLEPGQKIVAVAQFHRYREEPPISLVHIATHAMWIIKMNSTQKVRGTHERRFVGSNDLGQPVYDNTSAYILPKTGLSYPYLEPQQVYEVLN